MKIIVPFNVSDVSLHSSTVSATDARALAGSWNPATAYAVDDIVQVDSPTFTFTATANSTVLAATAHGFSDDEILKVSSSTTLPAGLSAGVGYYITQTTTDSFKLSLVRGGSPIVCTTTGTGTHTATVSHHRLYQRLVSDTTATPPHKDAVNWVYIGDTNRWLPFDSMVTSAAQNTDSISYVIDVVGRANAVGVINMLGASSETITVQDPGNSFATVYTNTVALATRLGPLNSWYTYFFTPVLSKYNFTDFNLPAVNNPRITVTLTGTGNTVSLGALVVGRSTNIGDSLYGTDVGITDYSVKSQDAYGNFGITPRSYSDTATFQILVDRVSVDGIKKVLTSVRATPCVFAGSDSYDSTVVFGFYRTFSITISYPTYSVCSMDVIGLN